MSQRPQALDALLAPLDPARRADMDHLDEAVQRLAPDLARSDANGMVSFGHCRYTYASGRSGETPSLSIASRAAGISVYVSFARVERWAARLPKADCGKGCIRLKHAADLDASVLEEIVAHARRINGKHLDWTGLAQREGVDPKVSAA